MATIADVCDVTAGQSPESRFYNSNGVGLPFYQGKKDFGERYLLEPTTWTESITKEATAGDILLSVRAPVGATNITRERVCIGRGLASLRPRTRINRDFLYYFLKHIEPNIKGTDGAVFPSLNKSQIEAMKLPIPPLSEQQRIVATLDKAFENIAKAKENAERNLANADDLGATITEDLIASRAQSSPTALLNAIAEFKNGLNFTRSSKGEVIKIVGVADFKNNFWTPQELEEVRIDGSLAESYCLRENDILVVRSNGNKELIGRCILSRGINQKTSHSGFTIRVRINTRDVDPEYLAHFLKSAAVRKGLVASGDGANISSLNQKALSSIKVPIPSLVEQRVLVKDINDASQKIEKLTWGLKRKSEEVEHLRQSLLHQAFSGGL